MKNKVFIIIGVVAIIIALCLVVVTIKNDGKEDNRVVKQAPGFFVGTFAEKCNLPIERAEYIKQKLNEVGVSNDMILVSVDGGNGIYVATVSDNGKKYKVSLGNGAIIIEDEDGNDLYFELN